MSGEQKKEESKEYMESNKDYFKQKQREYYENNKDIISERSKKYREEHPELLSEQRKKSRLLHIDKRKAHGKSYWAENAGEINEKRKQKITCECGQILSKWDISKHLKSSTHKYFVEHGVNRPQKAEKIKCEC